jgi:hypothetical protein
LKQWKNGFPAASWKSEHGRDRIRIEQHSNSNKVKGGIMAKKKKRAAKTTGSKKKKKKKKNKFLPLYIAAAALVIAGGIFLFWMNRPGRDILSGAGGGRISGSYAGGGNSIVFKDGKAHISVGNIHHPPRDYYRQGNKIIVEGINRSQSDVVFVIVDSKTLRGETFGYEGTFRKR